MLTTGYERSNRASDGLYAIMKPAFVRRSIAGVHRLHVEHLAVLHT